LLKESYYNKRIIRQYPKVLEFIYLSLVICPEFNGYFESLCITDEGKNCCIAYVYARVMGCSQLYWTRYRINTVKKEYIARSKQTSFYYAICIKNFDKFNQYLNR